MNIYFSKQKSTTIHYLKLKDFNNQDLKALLSKSFYEQIVLFEALRNSVNVTLEKQTTSQTRYSRANQAHP